MLITDLWRILPGKYFCISTKSPTGKWKDHYFTKDEFSQVRSFLSAHDDHDLYWCPHGLSRKSRKEDAAVPGKLLYADLDEADPRKINPKPTIAWETSPGRYAGIWLIDRPMTKELNRSLTYYVGADKSGWDWGQVLRIPGTINFKYDAEPKVKTLWDDAPPKTFRQIEQLTRGVGPTESSEAPGNVGAIYAKYEKRLPAWLRAELRRTSAPSAGKRSEMIWKIEHALLEAGCSSDESFALVKSSVWNKFRGRHNEDKQLKRELDKIRDEHFGEEPPVHSETSFEYFKTSIEDVEEENINWVWKGRLARGELTIVEGDPGLGKSYLVQMVARHLCDGVPLPDMTADDRRSLKPGKVLYFDMENSSGSVTKPRLVDNGLENTRNFFQDEGFFSIDDEEAKLAAEEAVKKHRPIMVVFDTLNTYIGKADTHKSSEAQQAMMWFRQLGRDYNCAVVVLRHLTKSSGKEKALYRGQGSIAFAGAARIMLTVGLNPEDTEERVVAVSKMNLTAPPKSLTFRILGLPDTRDRKDRSRLEWGEVCDLTADDILNVQKTGNDDSLVKKAIEFLDNVLGDGPVEATKVQTMADKRGISKRTLQRAADGRITSFKKGFGKTAATWWELIGE